ncbi:MAG: site-2 protease family protein [Acidimicrobiia bacterium]|nr:MAG: site-2 protease family protein [Acidimicrobiia bacterium]
MGPTIMIIGVVLMIVIHEGGHFVAAKSFGMKATEAFFGFGPKLWSTKRGETEYGVKAIPLGGYVRIIGMNPFEEIEPEDESRTYRAALFWKKTVVVLAGVATHFIVALFLLWFVGTVWGVITVNADGRVARTTTVALVSDVVPLTSDTAPARLAGTRAGDVIVAADGTPIVVWGDFDAFAKANGGDEVVITVERDGETLDLFATLATIDRPMVVDGEIVVDDNGDPVTERVGFFGVTPAAQKDQPGAFQMIPIALGQFGEAAAQSLSGLWQLIVGFPALVLSLFGGNDEILNTVRPISPIGLVKIAGPIESTLRLLALVNIFVGVLNFVPLYPLDGGHFAVAAYEKITGREPNVQKLLPVAAAVFIFLVTLGLMGVYLDIFRPIQ